MSATSEPLRPPSRFRALIVDDERVIRNLMRRALAKAGFDVSEAPDGQAALELLGHMGFDLVVSDIQMPRMSGLELLEHLSNHRPELPVILVSGSVDALGRQAIAGLGAFDLLTKPFLIDQLQRSALRAVAHLFKGAPRSQTGEVCC